MLRDRCKVHGTPSMVAVVQMGFLKEALVRHLNRYVHNVVRRGSGACGEAADQGDPCWRTNRHGLLWW